MQVEQAVVGWREWVSFPELGVPTIKAKVDTGARTSSLHAPDYEIYKNKGDDWVRFHIQPLRDQPDSVVSADCPVVDYRTVKDSGGHQQRRPFIRTVLQIGMIQQEIDLSLTDRSGMKFRMLLGRVALEERFIVDVSKEYLIGKAPEELS